MVRLNTAILLFDGVEVLDFAGPYEVFSRTRLEPGMASRRTDESAPFLAFTVARSRDSIAATGGLRVLPDHRFEDAPLIDILVVPGGFGTHALLEDSATIRWIQDVAGRATHVASVCTGALVLARAGLLDGRRATTHWGSYDHLAAMGEGIAVDRTSRYVDDGVITSGGVAAGIDMAFHMVERICGRDVANETARYIEYPRSAGSIVTKRFPSAASRSA